MKPQGITGRRQCVLYSMPMLATWCDGAIGPGELVAGLPFRRSRRWAAQARSGRLYLNVCAGLRIAKGGNPPSRRHGHGGYNVVRSWIRVVDAVWAVPVRVGRPGDSCPVRPARELLAGRYPRCGTQTPK